MSVDFNFGNDLCTIAYQRLCVVRIDMVVYPPCGGKYFNPIDRCKEMDDVKKTCVPHALQDADWKWEGGFFNTRLLDVTSSLDFKDMDEVMASVDSAALGGSAWDKLLVFDEFQ